MRIETRDGELAAEYTDGWVFHSEELEERYDGLKVYGFIGAPKVDGVDIIEIGGELPEDDYRFAYDLAGDDYVVSLNGSVEKGGPGSGHFGHGGRSGQRGGSAAKGTVSVEEHHERAAKWESKLSPTENRAVDTYVSYGYNTINGWLRETDGQLGPITDMDARRTIRSLDSALKKAPELDRDIVLYRGVEEIADTPLGSLKAGDKFNAHAYVSTSIHPEEASKFTGGAGKLLVINVPEGTRNVGFVSGGTSDEVILPRRTSESGFNNSMFVREVTADRMVVDFLPSRTSKGGARSGYYGHAGRPGQTGGSSGLPGYVARTTAMKELGVKHASRMNQYFKYGMPSTSVGGRRYVKWPEAQLWMNSYKRNGKGTRGIEAANTTMRSRGIPVGKHPPLPPPPPPSKPVTGRYAMDQLGIKHHSRLHSYKKHGMPTMKDPKTGKEVIKWPEAKLWYETYDKAGKGRAGIDAANKAVNSTGEAVPKPPAPPKPPDVVPETPVGQGKYEGVKVYANSKEKVSDVDHIKTEGFGPDDVGTAKDLRNVKVATRRLPQEHVDSVYSIESQTISEANREYGAGWGDNVAAWMTPAGRMGLIYDDRTTGTGYGRGRQWNKKSVVHEVGHGVYTSMTSFIGRTRRQAGARQFYGDDISSHTKKVVRIGKEYKRAKAGKKGAGFVTGYSRKNKQEFFAENYSYYVTKPGHLYQTNKSMYNFLKSEVFGGMEYSDFRFDSTVK